jgi:enoyl-CoA hydratase
MSESLLVSRHGPLVSLTLNRPDKLNALNAELLDALVHALDELGRDPTIHVAILTGAGDKAFAAGADIAAMATMSPAEAKAFSDRGNAVCSRIEHAHFPVIGAVHGFALGGGCEIALACDFLYASEKAKFGQPEVKLGVTPGFGGTQRLARRVGLGRARELCYTGAIIDAAEALRIGLVNVVVPPTELSAKAMETAKSIAAMGPLAVAECKRVILKGFDLPLPQANELEAHAFAKLFSTADQREGMSAFIAKRTASFTGK